MSTDELRAIGSTLLGSATAGFVCGCCAMMWSRPLALTLMAIAAALALGGVGLYYRAHRIDRDTTIVRGNRWRKG